jgi:hypothetical protein
MSRFTKIAVTVPTPTYQAVERSRKRLGKSRSATVALALEEWLRGLEAGEADRRYVEGYLRTPEAIDVIDAVAADATAAWGPWVPGKPSRAAEARASRPRKKRASR